MTQVSGDGGGDQRIAAYRLLHGFTSDVDWNTYDGTHDWPDGLMNGDALDLDAGEPDPDDGSWDVTQMVYDWATGVDDNDGLYVGDPDANHQGDGWADYASSRETTTSLRPYLELQYLMPCPSNPFTAAQTSSEGPVYAWNDALSDIIRDLGGAPTTMSRSAAMLNVAIFDTFNSVYFAKLADVASASATSSQVCGWQSYQVLAQTSPSTDADLAAGWAAKTVLTSLYPSRSTAIASDFSSITAGHSSQLAAQKLGEFVAGQVLSARSADGSSASMSYTPASTTPGAWRPTPGISTQAPCTTATTPGWADVTPFTMGSGDQFRRGLGSYTSYAGLLSSFDYAENVNAVESLGSKTSTTRTADETKAAWFWANDLNGTYKPPGQLLEATHLVALTQPAAQTSGTPADFFRVWSRQGIRVARLYADVSLAMADAAIAAWDEKYLTDIDLWRPIDAIRQADTDGNAATVKDAGWEPLSADTAGNQFSPCFPAWVSGHATFAAAWARVMDDQFRDGDVTFTDPFPLTLTSEDPHAVAVPGGDERSFDSFDAAAREDAESRVWLGVHYQFDADDGMATGTAVAKHADGNYLRWSQTCASWSCGVTIP
jgi:hypothetical protein